MLDRIDPGGDRHLAGGVAVAVGRRLATPVVRFVDDSVDLGLGHLRRIDGVRQGEYAARRHQLDHVGAVLDLEAHRRAALLGAVADAVDRPLLRHASGRERRPVPVAAGRSEGVHRGEHARTGDQPLVDRVAQADVDVVVGAEVAHGGEAGLERLFRVGRGVERLLGREAQHVVDEVLRPARAELHGEMDMGVHQAGEQRRVSEIDHRGARRHGEAGTRGDDLAALDDHHTVRLAGLARAVEDMRRLEHGALGCRRGLGREHRSARRGHPEACNGGAHTAPEKTVGFHRNCPHLKCRD